MTKPLAWTVQQHDELPSTQLLLKERAAAGAGEGLVIQALRQSGGYGRQGRIWVSPPGNLYCSVLLRPGCSPLVASQMALVTGVALAQALEPYVPGVLLKWPNDVLVDGRKLAGILLETEIGANGLVDWLALGVGVNIASAPPDIGISLSGKTGRAMDPASIREEFLERLAVCYTLWQAEGLGPLRSLWLGKAHPPGTPLKIKLGAGGLDGYFEGLDAAGNLLLKQESGETRVIASGEVHFGGSETAHVTGD